MGFARTQPIAAAARLIYTAPMDLRHSAEFSMATPKRCQRSHSPKLSACTSHPQICIQWQCLPMPTPYLVNICEPRVLQMASSRKCTNTIDTQIIAVAKVMIKYVMFMVVFRRNVNQSHVNSMRACLKIMEYRQNPLLNHHCPP